MLCKKIKSILSKAELNRLKDILRQEHSKPQNTHYAIFHFIDDVGDITYYQYYLSILYFVKNHKKRIDNSIKKKLLQEYENRSFILDDFRRKIRQKYYKYKQKDWKFFIEKSEYFFSLPEDTLNLSNRHSMDFMDRIYLGMGFEFLLKAIFLKKGYLINKTVDIKIFKKNGKIKPKESIKLGELTKKFIRTETSSLGYFINNLPKIKPAKFKLVDFEYQILAGLLIVQCWRNQEVHIPVGLRRTDNKIEQHIKYSHDLLYKIFLPKRNVPKYP